MTSATRLPQPPAFVSGGKRLNFTRRDEWTDALDDEFRGFGKDYSCVPSASWEELCAMATLIVNHPAYVAPTETDGLTAPVIEDAPDA